jgi:ankyrin repeat protein
MEVARILLRAGFNPDTKVSRRGLTPLHVVWSAEVIKLLLEFGANVHARNSAGATPLHWARSYEAVELLIQAGADVHARTHRGYTPMHFVPSSAVNLLLDAGADINAEALDGTRPYEYRYGIWYSRQVHVDSGFKLFMWKKGAHIRYREQFDRNAVYLLFTMKQIGLPEELVFRIIKCWTTVG